ncbi:hypothetical protein pb186bvf_019461 [Paramecium bursaria]
MMMIILIGLVNCQQQNIVYLSSFGAAKLNPVYQTSQNMTFILDPQALSEQNFRGYINVELIIQPNQLTTDLLLSGSSSQSPSLQSDNSLLADDADYNGYLRNKLYNHITLKSLGQGERFYITVLITRPIKYNLKITNTTNIQCPQNCYYNGNCYNETGKCSCFSGYIDEDCSIQAQQLEIGNQENYFITSSYQYFYYQQDWNNQNIEVTINSNSTTGSNIYVLIPKDVYVPTPKANNGAYTINNDKKYTGIIKFNSSDMTTVPKQVIFGVISPSNKDVIQITVNKYDDSNTNTMVIVYIVIAVIVGLVLIIVICILRRAHMRRYRLNQILAKQEEAKKSKNINQILDTLKKEDQIEGDCAICLENFTDGRELRKTPICNHLFHLECIKKWLEKHTMCPNCRFEIKSLSIVNRDQQL